MSRINQISPPLSRGGVKRIREMSDEELERILADEAVNTGTKVAALKVLRNQEKRDQYGSALLRKSLNPQFLDSVLLLMSNAALQAAIKNPNLPTDPVKVAASRIIDERCDVISRTAKAIRHQADLGF